MISYYLTRGGLIVRKEVFDDQSTQHMVIEPNDQAYLKWLAAGNTPEPADQP